MAACWPVDPACFPGWDGTSAGARQLQSQLAAQVRCADGFGVLRHVAGVDVGFEEQGRITRAAAVLLDADSMQTLDHALIRLPTTMPYIPGLLSFRELPALRQALLALKQVPDLVFCDGQGIAHPRRLGIAAHLGVATGLPSIGVAKSILVGRHEVLANARGARCDLLDGDERIGVVLRSRADVRPLIVSPGHRVSMDHAADLVMRFVTRYRLPEPTRRADALASRRGGFAMPLAPTPPWQPGPG